MSRVIFMKILNFVSILLIPLLTVVIVSEGILKKRPVFSTFTVGAGKGLRTTAELLPTLIGLLVAVGVLRASGLLEHITNLLGHLLRGSGFPTEVLPVLLVRLFSSSAATGLTLDLFREYGPDSEIGLLASIFMSCTETVFYTMSVYFTAVSIKNGRYTWKGAMLATLVGMTAAFAIVYL